MDDVAAVTALVAAGDLALHGEVGITADDLAADWSRPSFDLATASVIVTEHDQPVGYAEVFAGQAWVNVHPERSGAPIRAALVDWAERVAAARGAAKVGHTVSDADEAYIALLRGRGYHERWRSWIFRKPLDDPRHGRPAPAGVTLRRLRPGDERPLYELITTAFAEWPDREDPDSFEDWRAAYLERADADPDLIVVAEGADSRLVGVALCLIFGDEGWVQQLAVDRSHRGLGLGIALLHTAFEEFRRRGLATAGLSTDTRTGARDLYERVGMRVLRSYRRWSKPLGVPAP